jgi:hypothetical protein
VPVSDRYDHYELVGGYAVLPRWWSGVFATELLSTVTWRALSRACYFRMIWGFSYRLAMQGVTDLAALMAIGITVLHSFQITADSAHAKCSGRPCWGLLLARIATI